jgi:hypothetical protein
MGVLEPHGRGRRHVRPDALKSGAPPQPEGAGPGGVGGFDLDNAGAVIVVHTLAHAVGALRAAAAVGRPVTLLSARDAGIYAGPGCFAALVAAARVAVPAARCFTLLDCGDQPGAALAAIRTGIEGVIFTGRADVARRLADIAGQHGVQLVTERPVASLDLEQHFFASEEASEQACAAFLEGIGDAQPV